MIIPYQILENVCGPHTYGYNRDYDKRFIIRNACIYILEGVQVHENDANVTNTIPYMLEETTKLEPTRSSQNLYSARPAIYVYLPALQNNREEIENTIHDALWEYSRGQMSTYNSKVEIMPNNTLLVSSL
jgi:hypothetical protein